MKPIPVDDDYSYDIICLNKDEDLRLITLYVVPDLIHHTKDNKVAKEMWDTFKTFGIVNTTKVNWLENKFSNLKMGDFNIVEDYIARFRNLNFGIITSGGKEKPDSEYVSIVLNNLSPAYKSFAIIFYLSSVSFIYQGYYNSLAWGAFL